jgi:hypothetical protein
MATFGMVVGVADSRRGNIRLAAEQIMLSATTRLITQIMIWRLLFAARFMVHPPSFPTDALAGGVAVA